MAAKNDKFSVVYALGSNSAGQLGIGHDQDVSIPRQVLFCPGPEPSKPSKPVIRVAAGGNHTLLLNSDGTLYWAGDSSTGACGPQSGQQESGKSTAHEVVLPKNEARALPVKLIAATWQASIIVQSDSHGRNTVVSTFGVGMKGELAQGQLIVRTPSVSALPGFLPPDTEVVDLSACLGHVVAVLSNGDVWGWGNGRKGQLGVGVEGFVHEPRMIEGVDFRVCRAVCGREFTCLFGSPESGEIVVLGADKGGVRSCALGSAVGWKDVGASWGGVYVLKEDGTLMTWGRDDHGQLAPPGLPKLDRIAIGSEHAVVLTKDGDVLAWGWGEHGNCGPQVENGDVKGRWNVIASKKHIPPGSEITAIGAGCATSWISIEIPSQP